MTFTSFPIKTAAEKLGVTRRRLMEWLRSHPYDASGRAFYGSMGRIKLFTDDDLHRINAAIREDRPCLSSTHRGRASRRTGASGAPTASARIDAALTLVRELTTGKRLKRTSDAVLIRAAELTGDMSLLPSSRKSIVRP